MSAEDLLHALQQLAEAHGSRALAAAHQQIRRLAWKRRKEADRDDLPLANAVMASLEIRDQLRAAAADEVTINAGLEHTLRAFWPKPKHRDEPWRYDCVDCNDTGLLMQQCAGTGGICGRIKPHDPHDFGQPCFCARGVRFHEKQTSVDEVLAHASKLTKPTRFGR